MSGHELLKFCRSLLFMLCVASFPTILRAADGLTLQLDAPYSQTRAHLRALGWRQTNYAVERDEPTPEAKEMSQAMRSDFLNRGMAEVGSCFPTGLGECFAIWQRGARILIVEVLPGAEDLQRDDNAKSVPKTYFYYQVRLRKPVVGRQIPREIWDMRSADIVPGSYPNWRRQW